MGKAEQPRYNVAFNVCVLIGVGLVAVLQATGILASDNSIVLGIIYLVGVVIGFLLYRLYRLLRYSDSTFFGE